MGDPQGQQDSRDVVCGICRDRVWDKPEPERVFGILPNCSHPYCLGCLRTWRQTLSLPPTVIKSVSLGTPERCGSQGRLACGIVTVPTFTLPTPMQGLPPVPNLLQLHHPLQGLGECRTPEGAAHPGLHGSDPVRLVEEVGRRWTASLGSSVCSDRDGSGCDLLVGVSQEGQGWVFPNPAQITP